MELLLKEYIHNVEIRTVDGLRGVWTTKSINKGDIIFTLPKKYMICGISCKQVALELLDRPTCPVLQAWYDSVPSTDDFPIHWKDVNPRFKKLVEKRKKDLHEECDLPGYLHWRTVVGSRNFNCGENMSTCIVPFADMFNHSECPNTKWFFKNGSFYIVANQHIGKEEQVFDTYGKKTNYYNMLYYNFVPKGCECETRLCGYRLTKEYETMEGFLVLLRRKHTELESVTHIEDALQELHDSIKDDKLNELTVVNYWLKTMNAAKKIIRKKKGWKKYKKNKYLSKVLPKLLKS